MEIPEAFVKQFDEDLKKVIALSSLRVISSIRYDCGEHPENYVNAEQMFAAELIRQRSPKKVLDVGTNRHFVLGLLSAYDVTTIDVRCREACPKNEIAIVCDAKSLDLPSNSFDLVLSLCAIEHFGLGRYGDTIDLEADAKAVREMIRVLRPGGWLVFSTHIHRGDTVIVFNAHKIYSREHIVSWLAGTCVLITERFYRDPGFVPYDKLTTTPKNWNVYCGCWEKREVEW